MEYGQNLEIVEACHGDHLFVGATVRDKGVDSYKGWHDWYERRGFRGIIEEGIQVHEPKATSVINYSHLGALLWAQLFTV